MIRRSEQPLEQTREPHAGVLIVGRGAGEAENETTKKASDGRLIFWRDGLDADRLEEKYASVCEALWSASG